MQEVMAEIFSTVVSLAVGGLIGYALAYIIKKFENRCIKES